jgi:hypothetical protein
MKLTYSNKGVGIDPSEKGVPNGVAELDGNAKVPAEQLPSSVMEYKGSHDVVANSPTLADGTGDAGDVYRISVAGTRDYGSGAITLAEGDLLIYNGSIWERSPLGLAAVTALNDLIDVTVSSPGDGQVLRHNGSLFVNTNLDSGDVNYTQTTPSDWDSVTGSPQDSLDELAGRTRTLENTVVSEGDDTTNLNHNQADPSDWTIGTGTSLAGHLDELADRTKALEDNSAGIDGQGRIETIVKDGTTQTVFVLPTVTSSSVRTFEAILFVSHSTGTESVKLFGGQNGFGSGPYYMAVQTVGDGVLGWTWNIDTNTGAVTVDTNNDGGSATEISYRITAIDDNTGV